MFSVIATMVGVGTEWVGEGRSEGGPGAFCTGRLPVLPGEGLKM
jgi:hypothetical protein